MQLEHFFARVVPPGNYLAVTFKSPKREGMGIRMLPRDDLSAAAGFVRWMAAVGADVWYGLASYRMAVASGFDNRGVQKFSGERTSANAQALKAFWLDVDVQRTGDGKPDGRVYRNTAEAHTALKAFTAQFGLEPNLIVKSGYGFHLYWLAEDSMTREGWLPYAEALKSAAIQHQLKADYGVIADAARILRPPETLNLKDPAHPMPVSVAYAGADYPNALLYRHLQPFVATLQATGTQSSTGTLSGAPSALLATRQSSSAAAAQANMPARENKSYLFANIAQKCGQVKQSLATGGNGDSYGLWYLGHLSLTHFTPDGEAFAHDISKGDPRYTPVNIDQHRAQIAQEKAAKGGGAPLCTSYNRERPGVCTTCPFWGKINTPLVLGAEDGDLPDGYRRHNGWLQRFHVTKESQYWENLVRGDVYAPRLDLNGNTYTISFTYELANRPHRIVVERFAPPEPSRAMEWFSKQGMSLSRQAAPYFGDFVMAWIGKLREQQAERGEHIYPFGWVYGPKGIPTGFATGGTLYRSNGSQEAAPGGDPTVLENYEPTGTLEDWKVAAAFVTKNRPDLQVIVAAAFGAPLMTFTGHSGVAISTWSRDSAIGKSSAMRIAQTVWGKPKAMFSGGSTPNSVRRVLSQTRALPCFFDEPDTDKDKASAFVKLFFEVAQGQDKSRLSSDITLRATGEWNTIFLVASNKPLMDYVIQEKGNTDAGAFRLFEIMLGHKQMPLDTHAQELIATTDFHYGRAGQVYAEYLGKNGAAIKQHVKDVSKQFEKHINGEQGERFFVAGVACLLVGAQIANQLGLVEFSIKALHALLAKQFQKLRGARKDEFLVHSGQTDVLEILHRFVHYHSPTRLVTTSFVKGGKPDSTFKIVWAPVNDRQRLTTHISQGDRMMRLDKQAFQAFCRTQNLPPTEIINEIKARWGATVDRRVLGGGTIFNTTASIYVLEIPLTQPELIGLACLDQQPPKDGRQAPALAATK